MLTGQCVLCGLMAGRCNVCSGCRSDLPWIRRPCRLCGAPLPPDFAGLACGRCRVVAAGVDRFRAALVYEYPVNDLVIRAKFQSREEYARALGELLEVHLRAARFRGDLTLPDVLVPVPLHRKRLARRGFNQAEAIARPLAIRFHLPVLNRGCRRVVNTIEQSALAGAARRTNIRGAFRVSANVGGARVAVVDDVLTTGGTASALARELLAAGAESVEVWAVACSCRPAQRSGAN